MTADFQDSEATGPSTAAALPKLAVLETGRGPAFALFHGGVGSRSHWIRNIEALATRFRVLAFDLPGYGASPDVPVDLAPEAYIDWVATALVEAAPDGAHLAGFSFGGAVAARVAARLGKRIERLSLFGPGGFGAPTGRSIPLTKVPGPEAALAERRAVVAINLGQWMLKRAPAPDDPVTALQLSNIDRMRFDSRRVSWRPTIFDDLRAITAPVQMIWGGDDKLAYPSIQSRIASCREVRPDLQVVIVPDGGHWIQYEQADAVNRLLLAFHASPQRERASGGVTSL